MMEKFQAIFQILVFFNIFLLLVIVHCQTFEKILLSINYNPYIIAVNMAKNLRLLFLFVEICIPSNTHIRTCIHALERFRKQKSFFARQHKFSQFSLVLDYLNFVFTSPMYKIHIKKKKLWSEQNWPKYAEQIFFFDPPTKKISSVQKVPLYDIY